MNVLSFETSFFGQIPTVLSSHLKYAMHLHVVGSNLIEIISIRFVN